MHTLLSLSLALSLIGADVPPDAVRAIGAAYAGAVERVFEAHCADCHGSIPADLPAQARETAQRKGKKAHRRLNMDDGFPFGSKWELQKLMAKIRKAVEKDDMPPRKYMRLKGRALSEEERKLIIDWAAAAQALLKDR